MNKLSTVILSGLLMTSPIYVVANQTTIDSIEAAAQQLDLKALELQQQTSTGYDRALASYRLAVSFNLEAQTKQTTASLNSAIDTLEAILKQLTPHAEAHILLAQCYGFKASLNPLNAAVFSARAKTHLNQAESIDNSNPRLHLIRGIARYNTPTIYGGSKQAALKSFNQALKYYSDDQNSAYHWGEAEAYVWRGLSQLELNNLSSAMKDWGAALTIAPDYGWPRFLIQNNQ